MEERHNIRSAKGQVDREMVLSKSQDGLRLNGKDSERFQDKGSICDNTNKCSVSVWNENIMRKETLLILTWMTLLHKYKETEEEQGNDDQQNTYLGHMTLFENPN